MGLFRGSLPAHGSSSAQEGALQAGHADGEVDSHEDVKGHGEMDSHGDSKGHDGHGRPCLLRAAAALDCCLGQGEECVLPKHVALHEGQVRCNARKEREKVKEKERKEKRGRDGTEIASIHG